MNKNTNLIDLFIEFTNQIFWEGYASEISSQEPERFNYEFQEFKNTYNA